MSARCALGAPSRSCTAVAVVLVDGGVVAALACLPHGQAATRTAPGTVLRALGTPATTGTSRRGRSSLRVPGTVTAFPIHA